MMNTSINTSMSPAPLMNTAYGDHDERVSYDHRSSHETKELTISSGSSANSLLLTPSTLKKQRPKFSRLLSADSFLKSACNVFPFAKTKKDITPTPDVESVESNRTDTSSFICSQHHSQILDNGCRDERKRVTFSKGLVASQHAYPISFTDDEKKLVYYDSKDIKELQKQLRKDYQAYQQQNQHDFQTNEMDCSSSGMSIDRNSFCLRGIEKSEIVNPRASEISSRRYQTLVQALLQEQRKLRSQQKQSHPANNATNEDDILTIEERLRRLSMSMTRSDLCLAREMALQDFKESYPDAPTAKFGMSKEKRSRKNLGTNANATLGVGNPPRDHNDCHPELPTSEPGICGQIRKVISNYDTSTDGDSKHRECEGKDTKEVIAIPDSQDTEIMVAASCEDNLEEAVQKKCRIQEDMHHRQLSSQDTSQSIQKQFPKAPARVQDVELLACKELVGSLHAEELINCKDSRKISKPLQSASKSKESIRSDCTTKCEIEELEQEPILTSLLSNSLSKKTKKVNPDRDVLVVLKAPSPHHSKGKLKKRNDLLLTSSWSNGMNNSFNSDSNSSLNHSDSCIDSRTRYPMSQSDRGTGSRRRLIDPLSQSDRGIDIVRSYPMIDRTAP